MATIRVGDVLALHVNALTSNAKGSLNATRNLWTKLLCSAVDMSYWDDYLAQRTDARLVYREYIDPRSVGEDDVQRRVDQLCRNAERFLRHGPRIVYETPWNEQLQADYLLTRYSDLSCQAVDLMRARGFALVSVGHFSVQWPMRSGRHLYLPAIRKGDYLDLHTYSAPNMYDAWDQNIGHAIECAEWAYRETGKRTYFGEYGIDFGVLSRELSGWRTEGMKAWTYANQLRDAVKRLPACVEHADIYCCGTDDPRWNSFDVAAVGEIERLMGETIEVARLPEEGDVSDDLTVQFKGDWDAWRAAGGDRHHFEAHLVGIGRIEPTKDRLIRIASNAEASVKQIKAGLEKANPF